MIAPLGRGAWLAFWLVPAALLITRPALAQRVLECRFVSDASPGSALSAFSFAADIAGGQLRMLLVRPPANSGSGPIAMAFEPVRPGVSVRHELDPGTGDSGATAEFDLATQGAGTTVLIDEWRFGGTESYHALVLDCPAHG